MYIVVTFLHGTESKTTIKSFQELVSSCFYRQTTNSALPKTQGLFSRDYVRFREGNTSVSSELLAIFLHVETGKLGLPTSRKLVS